MTKWLGWISLGVVTIILFLYYLSTSQVQLAGDIPEYYGITQSLINHQSFHLTPQDQTELEMVLHPEYFNNPGYYITGTDGNRYPVHFVFYSILVTPVRLVLEITDINPLKALVVTNVLFVTLTLAYIMKRFVRDPMQQLILLTATLLSPIAFFLSWPGPDVMYLALLLLSLAFAMHQAYFYAALMATIASWHSQPLIVVAVSMTILHFIQINRMSYKHHRIHMEFHPLTLITSAFIGLIALVPYGYNWWAFGVLTPWTSLKDGWTIINGFGLHNASLWKLYEQFFDLNIGLIWYMPVMTVAGIVSIYGLSKYSRVVGFITIVFLITAFFYQTNPAWHYGTAGFGPSRHIIFLIPLFIIALTYQKMESMSKSLGLLIAIAASQLYVLPMNGFLSPNFELTLHHNPIATYILNTTPALYSPTPEIFVDRTNHTDTDHLTTAIYKIDGVCKKAYVTYTDVEKLTTECGFIPEYAQNLLDNDFLRKSNTDRMLLTTDVTLWPDPGSCGPSYRTGDSGPYVCMKSVSDVTTYTGMQDAGRIRQVDSYDGVWRIEYGDPVRITVPPGYIAHHTALTGVYVNY